MSASFLPVGNTVDVLPDCLVKQFTDYNGRSPFGMRAYPLLIDSKLVGFVYGTVLAGGGYSLSDRDIRQLAARCQDPPVLETPSYQPIIL